MTKQYIRGWAVPGRQPITLLVIFFSLFGIAFNVNAWAECPADLAAYWRMEEDGGHSSFNGYLDESPNTLSGMCAITCPSVTSNGAIEKGQNFDGNSTGIAVATSTIFDFSDSDPFSIELWFKRQGISGREVLIGRYSNTSSMNWWVGIQSSGRLAFSLTSSQGETALLESNVQKNVTNGAWHHVVAMRTNGQNRLYVDGKLEQYENINYSDGFTATEPITIGYLDNDTPAYHFGGAIDEVAIHKTTLSDDDIQMHYYLSRGYCAINDTPVKIMPLGDSITYDSHSNENRTDAQRTGYRWPLWLWLENGSFWVDFVGSEQQSLAPEIQPAFDYNNAGFPGITINQLAHLLDTGFNQFDGQEITQGPYLQFYPPDIILLHIGTNGLAPDANGVAAILDEIDEYDERITVILAKIISRIEGTPGVAETTAFNTKVATMAMNRIDQNGDKIIMVDMENGAGIVYDYTANGGDMYDTLHPDLVADPFVIESGYGKMADVWFGQLQDVLPQSSLPSISSTPSMSVNKGNLYQYQIETTGDPKPSLVLSEPDPVPTNFSFDEANQRIIWVTGAASSDLNVAFEATNWLGTDTQAFTIIVNDAPVVIDIPNQTILEGESFAEINLDAYVDDPEDPDEELSWTYSGNTELIVEIVDRQVRVLNPDENWYGTETITFRATDPGGLFAVTDATFTVNNINDPPVISDNTTLVVSKNAAFTIQFDDLTVVDPDNVYPDDFSMKVYGGSNYSMDGNLITPASGFTGELQVPVSVNDGQEDSNVYNLKVVVDGVGSNSNSSGASLCFIDTILN